MEPGDTEGFLRRKGALQVVLEIGTGSTTFQDIGDAAVVSSSTVSARLKEGVEKGLFEVFHQPTDYGTQKRYRLTEVGQRVYARMQEIDLDTTVRTFQRIHRQRDTELERLIDRVNRDRMILMEEHQPDAGSWSEADIESIPDEQLVEEVESTDLQQEQLDEDLLDLGDTQDDASEESE